MLNHVMKYPECPMRHEFGNCMVHGGFCADAVSDEICDALHQAYEKGLRDGAEKMKELFVESGNSENSDFLT